MNKLTRSAVAKQSDVGADAELATHDRRWDAIRYLHSQLFAEENDWQYDSYYELQERKRGMSPMSREYLALIAAKREALGVSPLNQFGRSTDGESMELCRKLVDGIAACL